WRARVDENFRRFPMLAGRRQTSRALFYVAASVLLCLGACALGFLAAAALGNALSASPES
ncbi:MAG: hypothetical protein B7Z71_01930, partial [Acidocella sp. 21-58-7]